jgi:hypothetical protein
VLILVLLVSLSAIIHYGWYKDNTVITTQTTGCTLSSTGLVCNNEAYDLTNKFHLYGYSVHFLDVDDHPASVVGLMDSRSLLFQGQKMTLYLDGVSQTEIAIFAQIAASTDFNQFFAMMETGLLIGLLAIHILGNLALLLLIGLISTIPFIRLKKFIRYKTIYKLVLFAITPVALLMSIYNLLEFNQIIFFVLMFVCYRSLYQLQRELNYQTLIHIQKQTMNIVDSDFQVLDEDEENQSDDEDKSEDN